MTVFVGTSGWQYKDWREVFYPRGVPQARWLPYFAERFRVVEVNNTFYQLPKPETFAGWREGTPSDFIFALKFSRYLTHVKRLKDPEEPVRRFLDAAAGLGEKMGPLLLQLPENLHVDADRLRKTLQAFPKDVRVAVEFRHESWYSDDVRRLLEEHGAALCLADRGSQPITPLWRTADWAFIRLHEGRATPHPCYGRSALDSWAERIAEQWSERSDVYVFFNNDAEGCAVRDAHQLALALEGVGLKPSRTPSAEDIHLA